MIYDGYTLNATLGRLSFAYRPALYAERKATVESVRFHRSEEMVDAFIGRHVPWINQRELTEQERIGLFYICLGIMPPETGGDWERGWEKRDADNLYEGVILSIKHPQFAKRDCGMCKKWWYDDDTGKIAMRGKKPLLRPLDTVLLCETETGCPKGTPEDQKSLSPKNQLTWQAYREWSAVGAFPDDPIVRRNAWIIERAMKKASKR